MSIDNLKDLFQDELKDMYNAESQILKALPKLIRAAQETSLRDALENHLEETEKQKERLEQIFTELGMPARGKTCDGMKGIIEEGDGLMDEVGESISDAAIIAAAQKVEHYEIASYGTLRTWAETLGLDKAAELLQESLDEEKAADVKMTEIAVTCANLAVEAEEGSEDEEESGSFEGEESEEAEETVSVRGRGRPKGSTSTNAASTTSAARRRDRSGSKPSSR